MPSQSQKVSAFVRPLRPALIKLSTAWTARRLCQVVDGFKRKDRCVECDTVGEIELMREVKIFEKSKN